MQKRNTFTVQEAKKKLEHYCAYQERCHQEVVQKLRSMNMIPHAIDIIVGELIDGNYLNETRFAESFARGKFRIKKWGKERIVRELKFRNISPFNIKIALQEISTDDYLASLTELAKRFWEANATKDKYTRKKKVIDALRYRGWESTLIFDAVAVLEREA